MAEASQSSENEEDDYLSEGSLHNGEQYYDDDEGILFQTDDFDSSRLLERSASDAALTRRDIQNRFLYNAISSFDDSDDVPLSGHRVSESSRVFLDLSKIDSMESENNSVSAAANSMKDVRFKLKMNQSLETIPQDQVLQVSASQTKYSYSSLRSYSSDALDDIQESDDSIEPELVAEHSEMTNSDSLMASSYYSKYPLLTSQSPVVGITENPANWQNRNNLKLKYQQYCLNLEKDISDLKRAIGKDEIKPLNCILNSIKEAWNFPVYGRDLSHALCDIIRNESVLSLLIKNCRSEEKELLTASACLLEQVMTSKNREAVANQDLRAVVKMTQKSIGDRDMSRSTVGILENLFKVSEEVSSKVIEYGGLDAILYWCKCADMRVLRKCSKALSNLSLFGGPENQEIMTQQNVPEWLFPLAFLEDKYVRYYACMSIAVLVANKELEASVIKSGTLDLVIPFVSKEKPEVFAKSDYSHRQGRDPEWLKRLKPLLCSRRPEAQALAAFHFAMEACIKAEQGKQQVFYDIDVVEPLKKVASSPNAVASRFAREALQLIGEEVPHKLSQQVPLWTVEDVAHWVAEVGFRDYSDAFEECKIDGDLLLQIEETDLIESIKMSPGMMRKRFHRELVNLKVTADYSSYDPTKIDPWLMSILPELSQYTYAMLRSGMDRNLLASTTDEELRDECGIFNGVHRRIILQHLSGLNVGSEDSTPGDSGSWHPLLRAFANLRNQPSGNLARSSVDVGSSLSICPRPVDVFISYRRSTGSQLASLLKVHLQLRGFSVFLDIDRLRAGKFDENLLMNIKLAKHFLLVLTTNALDRCIGDMEQQDWVHKEIVTALETHCNIIPILDNCEWPEPEQLPEDMRQVCYFNGIRWIHDYQDACIDKLYSFIRGLAPIEPSKPLSPSSQGETVSKEHIPVCSLISIQDQQGNQSSQNSK